MSFKSTSDTRQASALQRTLKITDYFSLAFGSMVGVGWLLVIDDWLRRGGPLGAILAFLVGGLMLFPIGYVYGRLTQAIPDAGSEVAYTRTVFKPWLSFGSGWLMTLAYLIVCPWEAVAIGKIVGYIFPSFDLFELYRVAGRPIYATHLLIGIFITAMIVFINYRGIKLSTTFQNVTTFGLLIIFLLFSMYGLAHGKAMNFRPGFSLEGSRGILISVLLVMQIVPYFMTGFEAVPKCSEEASLDFKSHGFSRAIFLSIVVGMFFYATIIAVVAFVYSWQELITEKFATAVAFKRAFQSDLMVNLIMAAALLSLLKVFNGNFLAGTRLLFALGRSRLVEPHLGKIHSTYRTPTNAVLLAGLFTLLGPIVGEAILIPITEVGSLASAVGWLASCVAFLMGVGRAQTKRYFESLLALIGAAFSFGLILMKLLPFVPGHFRFHEYAALSLWIIVGILLWRNPKAETGRFQPMGEGNQPKI